MKTKPYKDVEVEIGGLSEPPAIVQLLIAIGIMFLDGLIITHMWSWFVTPIGLPPLSIFNAIGLNLLITFLVTTTIQTKQFDFWYKTSHALIVSLATWGCGFIIYLFM